jgi:hypothetical protein
VFGGLTAPGPPVVVPPGDAAPPVVRGAYHVHTTRSDGRGDVSSVAAAAARTGLDVVIVTDHGDGTRPPDAPAYHEGVLVIDAVEVSTEGGHVVALRLPGATPYPLGGEARAVVEDIQRLGGVAIAAHPASPSADLAWRAGDLPIDGVEWLNVDSAWRDAGWPALGLALLRYPFRPAGTLAGLLDRPEPELAWWDALAASRRVVGLPAVDAHGGAVPGVPAPSYESTFGLLEFGLEGVALTGDAAADAAIVLAAVTDGRAFSVVSALAEPGVMRFDAARGADRYAAGDLVPAGEALAFEVRADGPAGARLEILRDGVVVASGGGGVLRHEADGAPGAYRAEVHLPTAPGAPPVPWMMSNPILVGPAPGPVTADGPPGLADALPAPASDVWRLETGAVSEGAIDAALGLDGRPETLLRYAVSGRASESPYVAFVVPVDGTFAERNRIGFVLRADRPLRLDVQVRTPTPQPGAGEAVFGERWHRSVWADTAARDVILTLDELLPQGPAREAPDPARIDSLLFVIDTVNTPAGSSGRVWLSDVRFGRAP